ncbi:hypothetical protein FQA47_002192 [Oryzias melastigma]|uniref:Uncharacterized protein n=1 Tax=Oryzias melastigma TaxID=30732 RepID=A0A834C3V8_ORYME|nr:hypothetical protein FQA47_002192 [Oryzias melastigma]
MADYSAEGSELQKETTAAAALFASPADPKLPIEISWNARRSSSDGSGLQLLGCEDATMV